MSYDQSLMSFFFSSTQALSLCEEGRPPISRKHTLVRSESRRRRSLNFPPLFPSPIIPTSSSGIWETRVGHVTSSSSLLTLDRSLWWQVRTPLAAAAGACRCCSSPSTQSSQSGTQSWRPERQIKHNDKLVPFFSFSQIFSLFLPWRASSSSGIPWATSLPLRAPPGRTRRPGEQSGGRPRRQSTKTRNPLGGGARSQTGSCWPLRRSPRSRPRRCPWPRAG